MNKESKDIANGLTSGFFKIIGIILLIMIILGVIGIIIFFAVH